MNKILIPEPAETTAVQTLTIPMNGIPFVAFPVGTPESGGSCEFATEKCLRLCYARGVGGGNSVFSSILKFFEENTEGVCASTLAAQAKVFPYSPENDTIGWFATGDCPSQLTKKIFWIIRQLDLFGFNQVGFTRNRRLWAMVWEKKRNSGYLNKTVLNLTVENPGKEELNRLLETGSVAVPDYRSTMVTIHTRAREPVGGRYGCGATLYKTYDESEEWRPAVCSICSRENTGCFSAKCPPK